MRGIITSGEFDVLTLSHQPFVLLDVRSEEEWKNGNIPGSISLPHWLLPFRISKLAPDKNAFIVVYCLSGERSQIAETFLESYGYTHVKALEDGYQGYGLFHPH